MEYLGVSTELLLVAGLHYRLNIYSGTEELGLNISAARLRLVEGAADSDARCVDPARLVTDFGGSYSDAAGDKKATVSGATTDPAVTCVSVGPDGCTVFGEARFPWNGTYGLCYAEDEASPVWRAIQTVALHVFGAPRQQGRQFYCPTEQGHSCLLRVDFPEPAARTALVLATEECGQAAPKQTPFARATSLPTLNATAGYADHDFLGGSLPRAERATFRVCLCHGFEFNTADDGVGHCASTTARDFTQSLGYLHVTAVAVNSDASAAYAGPLVTLHMVCGDRSFGGGCTFSEEPRMRLVDPTSTTGWEHRMCESAGESPFYVGPANIHIMYT